MWTLKKNLNSVSSKHPAYDGIDLVPIAWHCLYCQCCNTAHWQYLRNVCLEVCENVCKPLRFSLSEKRISCHLNQGLNLHKYQYYKLSSNFQIFIFLRSLQIIVEVATVFYSCFSQDWLQKKVKEEQLKIRQKKKNSPDTDNTSCHFSGSPLSLYRRCKITCLLLLINLV